jgi:hypothetical protein
MLGGTSEFSGERSLQQRNLTSVIGDVLQRANDRPVERNWLANRIDLVTAYLAAKMSVICLCDCSSKVGMRVA